MTKRKYADKVSEIVYGWEIENDGTLQADVAKVKDSFFRPLPCRIIRESFYRRIISCYEQWGDRGLEK